MIIVCPECSTKFKVNPDRIPETGAQVRCARCKHVFLANKPTEHDIPVETIPEDQPQVSPDQIIDHSENRDGTETDSDFSYDKFQELDSNTAEEETFTFGEESSDDSNNAFSSTSEVTGSELPDDNNFTFGESEDQPVSPIEKVIGTNKDDSPMSEPTDQEVPPQQELPESPAEPEFPSHPAPEKKGGAASSIIRILLLIILGILIVGGVFIYMNGTDQFNQTIQQFLGQNIDQPAQAGQITLANLEGKFIKNDLAGELFLIRGNAINSFAEPRAAIQVKGVIFDQNGKPLLQKTVFCGNAIDDEKLSSLPFSELEEIMGNQFGSELSNMKVDSKQVIPFDIVFKDLPKNLSEFSVKVTSSQPATE